MAHRDLKLENLLCQTDNVNDLRVKLTDFGFATFLNPEKKLDLSLGSPMYMAPELVAETVYDEKIDVWAIGVITYILLTGRAPFMGRNKQETYDMIIKDRAVPFPDSLFSNISASAKDFVK